MYESNHMRSEENQQIGRIRLLEGESVRLTLHSRYGLLEEVHPEDDCVVLTDRRLIGSWLDEGRHREVLLPLQNVDAVEVTDRSRGMGPLATGGLLVLAAAAVVWLAAAFNLGGVLPWIIGAVLGLLGAVKASTYFVVEDPVMITFRSRTSEVALPLRTSQALEAAYELAHGFFQARAGQVPTPAKESFFETPQPPESSAPLQEDWEPKQGSDAAFETPQPLESSAPWQEVEGGPQSRDDLVSSPDPHQSTETEPSEQPTDSPAPSTIRHHPESSQAQGRSDV